MRTVARFVLLVSAAAVVASCDAGKMPAAPLGLREFRDRLVADFLPRRGGLRGQSGTWRPAWRRSRSRRVSTRRWNKMSPPGRSPTTRSGRDGAWVADGTVLLLQAELKLEPIARQVAESRRILHQGLHRDGPRWRELFRPRGMHRGRLLQSNESALLAYAGVLRRDVRRRDATDRGRRRIAPPRCPTRALRPGHRSCTAVPPARRLHAPRDRRGGRLHVRAGARRRCTATSARMARGPASRSGRRGKPATRWRTDATTAATPAMTRRASAPGSRASERPATPSSTTASAIATCAGNRRARSAPPSGRPARRPAPTVSAGLTCDTGALHVVSARRRLLVALSSRCHAPPRRAPRGETRPSPPTSRRRPSRSLSASRPGGSSDAT